MHIALVSQEYPPGKHGGIGAQTKAKADGLSKLGHAVTVLTHDIDITVPGEGHTSGNVARVGLAGYDRQLQIYTEPARWLTHSVGVASEIAKLHEKRPVDLIDFAEWAAEGYTFFVNRTQYNYIPAVVQFHGPLAMFGHTMNWPALESTFYHVGTHMERTCVQLADALFSSSRCSIEWCKKYYGISAADVPVLHTGVDTRIFRPCDRLKQARPTIIFIGKLVENKGVLQLAEAARNLLPEFPQLQVWLFGNGEPNVIERLQEIGKGAADPNFLQMRGFISRQELPGVLCSADIFAAPSIYEGGPGFVYLEAMSCGLPVIACSGSGASEVVAHEDTGLLVPPHDVDALTAALYRLLSDLDLRLAIGRRARDWAVIHADTDMCMQRLVSFYESVIAKCSPTRSLC